MNKIQELVDTIKRSSMAYYTTGTPLITDEQFDSVVEDLRLNAPDHPILTTPGWGAFDSEDGKIEHLGKRSVGSLEKYCFPELSPRFSEPGLGTPKLDGLTVILSSLYSSIVAATRNEGTRGKDCTPQLLYILQKKYPNFLAELRDHPGIIAIRGEVLPNPASANWFREQGIASPRNWTAGLINRNEPTEDLDHVIFIPYFIRWDSEQSWTSQAAMLTQLAAWGAHPIPFFEFEIISAEELSTVYQQWKMIYNIDGLVISSLAGWNSSGPDFSTNEALSFAYKFPSEKVEVVVRDVLWATGSSGRVVPRVQYEPVFLAGAKLQFASAFNATFIQKNGIDRGAHIVITRAGEVIPHIVDVRIQRTDEDGNAFSILPTQCPTCSNELEWKNSDLVCPSLACPAKAWTALKRLFEFTGMVDGLADATLRKWLDEFPVNGTLVTIQDLQSFIPTFRQAGSKANNRRVQLLQEHFGDHFGLLLHQFEKNIESKLNIGLNFSEFWYTINVPGLAQANSKRLGQINPLDCRLEDFQDLNVDTQKSLENTESYWRPLAKFLVANGIALAADPVEAEEFLMTVAVTGSVSMPRKIFESLLADRKILLAGITRETRYLISNEPSKSSTTKAAEKLGVKVVTESEFWDLLEKEYNVTRH